MSKNTNKPWIESLKLASKCMPGRVFATIVDAEDGRRYVPMHSRSDGMFTCVEPMTRKEFSAWADGFLKGATHAYAYELPKPAAADEGDDAAEQEDDA